MFEVLFDGGVLDRGESGYLSPAGTIYWENEVSRLVCTIGSKKARKVRRFVDARNQWSPHPFISKNLLTNEDSIILKVDLLTKTVSPIECIRWPTRPSNPLKSIDGFATLSLSPHLQSFTVEFPLQVYDPDTTDCEYIRVRQVHSILDGGIWALPLAIVMENYQDSQASYAVSPLPVSLVDQSPFSQTEPRGRVVRQYHPLGFFHILQDLQIEFHFYDGGFFRADAEFEYVQVYTDDGCEMCSVRFAPEKITDRRYPLSDLLDIGLKLYQQTLTRPGPDPLPFVLRPNKRIAHFQLPGAQCHVYSDGSLKFDFDDQTTLELTDSIATIRDSFAETVQVRIENPIVYSE